MPSDPKDGRGEALSRPTVDVVAADGHRQQSRFMRFASTWGILLFAGSIWGVTFSLAKFATQDGQHPFTVAMWQAIYGTALLSVYLLLWRRRVPLDRAHLKFYLFCGVFGTALPSVLFFYAATHLPAGVLSIAIATVPLLTFVTALVLRVERFEGTRVAGVVLGITAVAMIMLPESSLPDPGTGLWVVAGVAAAACYAVENMFIALRRPLNTDAVTLLFGMMAASIVLLVPIVIVTGTFSPFAWPPGRAEYSVFSMAAINVVSYSAFVYLVTRAGPVFASQTAYLITLTGVFWGIVIFGENHSPWIWAALVVMMVGLTLVKPRE